jgi:hypothetical protein
VLEISVPWPPWFWGLYCEGSGSESRKQKTRIETGPVYDRGLMRGI